MTNAADGPSQPGMPTRPTDGAPVAVLPSGGRIRAKWRQGLKQWQPRANVEPDPLPIPDMPPCGRCLAVYVQRADGAGGQYLAVAHQAACPDALTPQGRPNLRAS